MSVDVDYFQVCDHVVNGKVYRPDMCSKCQSRGYFLDLAFDKAGNVILAKDIMKLQQECLKVILDEKTSDLFYPSWGSEIYLFIGKKKTLITKARLEMAVRRAIEHLKEVQQYAANENLHITNEEIIKDIEYIGLEPISVTGWKIDIVISNLAKEYSQFSITL